jgi:hypothetical protein
VAGSHPQATEKPKQKRNAQTSVEEWVNVASFDRNYLKSKELT